MQSKSRPLVVCSPTKCQRGMVPTYKAPTYARLHERFFRQNMSKEWNISRLQEPDIKSITFGPGFNVTNGHLLAITTLPKTLCESIECLYAGDTTFKLTDSGVSEFIAGCSGLRVLSLCAAFNLTDAVVLKAAKECPLLEMLCVTGHSVSKPGRVGDGVIYWLLANPHQATALRKLVLLNQPGIDEETVRLLSLARKGMEIIVSSMREEQPDVRIYINGNFKEEPYPEFEPFFSTYGYNTRFRLSKAGQFDSDWTENDSDNQSSSTLEEGRDDESLQEEWGLRSSDIQEEFVEELMDIEGMEYSFAMAVAAETRRTAEEEHRYERRLSGRLNT